jgi:hypothetical protein
MTAEPAIPEPAIVDGKHLRAIMGRKLWYPPTRYPGPTDPGWFMVREGGTGSIIVSAAPFDGVLWIHTSFSRITQVPTYEELGRLKWAVFADGWAYQVFAPAAHHINIHPHALHLWGRADGQPDLPDFSWLGSI